MCILFFNLNFCIFVGSYIHRVGRTARAGREGYAVTFVTDNDRSLLHAIVSITLFLMAIHTCLVVLIPGTQVLLEFSI